MKRSLDFLTTEARRLAEVHHLNTDREVYRANGHDPYEPLLFGGNLKAPLAFFGRDPGRDEIRLWQPLIGSAGRRVRGAALRQVKGIEVTSEHDLVMQGGKVALYSNTVPYKQVGNKAWGPKLIREFQPLIAELLVNHWHGSEIITLGNEAFQWFGHGIQAHNALVTEALWARPDRYESKVKVSVKSPLSGDEKQVIVRPLPHPSPLNARWYGKFPALMDKQLSARA